MAAKNDSMNPKPQESFTSVSMPGITGRTPEVPLVDQSPVDVTLRPLDAQEHSAPEVARELGASTTWRSDFGKHAPDPATAVALLQEATAYTDEAVRAQAWRDHIVAQRDRKWQQALVAMGVLKPHFDLADQNDPNIASRYDATKGFFAARAAVAARGVVTRRKNRTAKKKKNPA